MASPDAVRLLDFYRETSPDHCGRYLRDILQWSDRDLEDVHNYIQWLFPTFERSSFQPDVPILTREIADAFRADHMVQRRLAASFDRMLRFYGFGMIRGASLAIAPASNFNERAIVWLKPSNHNHLRITRILKSIAALGMQEEAIAFFNSLKELYENSLEVRSVVQDVSFRFWRLSVTG